MNVDALPILGEPIPIELANTLYGEEGARIDFLETRDGALLWIAHGLGKRMETPERLTSDQSAALRGLRDAVFELVSALCDRRCPAAHTVREINRFAAKTCAHPHLVWNEEVRAARVKLEGDRFSRMCAALATACIELCVDPTTGDVRRCAGPGCSLFFVQDHRRRRFCHESCSHRARQQRYAGKVRSLHEPLLR